MVRPVTLAVAVTLATALAPLAARAADAKDAPKNPVDHAALMAHDELSPKQAQAKATILPASGIG